ncbi:hypothetical protein MESS2_690009 [Mesorhizobium metallidurans STM 2683]|uniref:Uncharacterized protein n=1 Tax=Mesorhizobium metallidurans STM 2683 TaxID=1297569 RepID=M5EUU1_9HYPH|nr:hypothetical protein MESS2_690009 [Mesorhizobium metallidurans STM 2683]
MVAFFRHQLRRRGRLQTILTFRESGFAGAVSVTVTTIPDSSSLKSTPFAQLRQSFRLIQVVRLCLAKWQGEHRHRGENERPQ